MQQASRTVNFDQVTSATHRQHLLSQHNRQHEMTTTLNYPTTTTTIGDVVDIDSHSNNPAYGYEYYYMENNTNNTNNCLYPSPVNGLTDIINTEAQYHEFEENLQTYQVVEERASIDNQQLLDPNARDSLTIALEEIGALVNGKELTNLTHEQKQATFSAENNNCDHQQQVPSIRIKVEPKNNNNITQQIENTQVSEIYESLRKQTTIDVANEQLDLQSDITMAKTNETTNNTNHHYTDLFTRCVGPDGISMAAATSAASGAPEAKPYVEIIEQPAKCALRFRYKCEGRSAGSLPGVNSTSENKTYPTIRINNYLGRAVVVISCVTKDAPYKAHPHNIVGKEGCKKGICTIVLNNNNNNNNDDDNGNKKSDDESTEQAETSGITRTFNGLGIQCVKRRDIEESLSLRESINVDPFRNGFVHKLDTSNMDLNVLRLCFQVFIEGTTPNKCDIPLTPIVSDLIHDKKAMSDLVITKLSHCSAPATGGREVILLCDRISKDDIQVRFFEERDNELIWETYCEISPADVHKQVAICLRTPKYYNEHITQPVMARIQLRRISDNQVSEPRLFQFLPCESDEDIISRKRQKIEWVNMNHYALDNILQSADHQQQQSQHQQSHHHHQMQQQPQLIHQPHPQQQQQQQHHQASHLHQPQASHSTQRQQQ